ncbi:MAG: hypothetical protein NTZ74_12730 [Chloroflexi bacterium]|nr:hypothetical protein [Chloroflexota bacterium]
MTAMQTISLQVLPEAARAFLKASEEDRRKLELLISLRLLEVARARKPLEEVMRGISRSALARGLTPDILDDILKH